MDDRYLPMSELGMLDHIIEEASELIKAVIKIKRFGVDSLSNFSDLIEEADDVRYAVSRYKDYLERPS